MHSDYNIMIDDRLLKVRLDGDSAAWRRRFALYSLGRLSGGRSICLSFSFHGATTNTLFGGTFGRIICSKAALIIWPKLLAMSFSASDGELGTGSTVICKGAWAPVMVILSVIMRRAGWSVTWRWATPERTLA